MGEGNYYNMREGLNRKHTSTEGISTSILVSLLSFCVLLWLPQHSLSICSDPSKFKLAYGSRHPLTI